MIGKNEAEIFKAQSEFLADSELIQKVCQLLINGHGVSGHGFKQ